jgi:hypothetical protein
MPNSENSYIKRQIIGRINYGSLKGLKVVALNIKAGGLLLCVD